MPFSNRSKAFFYNQNFLELAMKTNSDINSSSIAPDPDNVSNAVSVSKVQDKFGPLVPELISLFQL